MRNFLHTHSHPTRRRGAILVMAAFCISLSLSFLAFSVDLGHIVVTSSELQNAADAAALSGARALATSRSAAIAAAELWGERNIAAGALVTINSGEDIEVGLWDSDTKTFTPLPADVSQLSNAVRVTCRRTSARGNPLPLFFAPAFGTRFADVAATAIASLPKSEPGKGSFRFLVDDEMFDTDEPAIEKLASSLKTSPDALLQDGDDDGFIDIPGGTSLELPTGQVGDEALFDTQSYEGAFPFGEDTPYSHLDFLAEGTALESSIPTRNLQDVEWTKSNAPHNDFIGKKVLDPVPGTAPVSQHAKILSLSDPNVTHVIPVFKSDVSMQETDPSKYGSPTANLQGERRGLVAFKILSARPNPKGGSYLPLLTIQIVNPAEVNVKDLNVGTPSGVSGSSTSSTPQLVN